jgi:NADH dehydrogenase
MKNHHQVTLFGGCGFIGQHIVQRLAQRDATIKLPTRDLGRALTFKPMGAIGQIVPFLSSVHSEAALAEAMRGSDTVINLIGILFERGKNSFQAIHVELAARIARIAREQGVQHFVHFSALGADKKSASRYARSKAVGEDAVRTFFPEAIILRPSIVFGPEDGFFNLFASLSRFSPALPLIGGGLTKFQPVYVGDVADAILAALDHPAAKGHDFDLGGPQVYTFRQLLELMSRIINRHPLLLPVPWPLAYLQAACLQLLPTPLLTPDQVTLLKRDNVLPDDPALDGLRQLGITPTALEIILPTYLDAYRAGGRLGSEAA